LCIFKDGSHTNLNSDVRDTASLGGQKSAIFNGRGGTSGRSRGSSFGNNAGLNFKVFL